MIDLEKITKSPFYEIVCIIDELGQLDLMKHAERIDKRPAMLSHDEYFLNIRTMLLGIISAISYMELSVLHIQRRHSKQYFLKSGYIDYDVYKYHYSAFCHGITTLHDLYFKLVVELCDLKIGSKRMIQWDDLKKTLKSQKEENLINLLENFYAIIKVHEQKRNKVSHEGLLSSPLLDNYYCTHIWTNNASPKNSEDNTCLEYTEGTKENKYLLRKTKKEINSELTTLINQSINCTLLLFEQLLPKVINKVSEEFINSHLQFLKRINNKSINKYILTRVEE